MEKYEYNKGSQEQSNCVHPNQFNQGHFVVDSHQQLPTQQPQAPPLYGYPTSPVIIQQPLSIQPYAGTNPGQQRQQQQPQPQAPLQYCNFATETQQPQSHAGTIHGQQQQQQQQPLPPPQQQPQQPQAQPQWPASSFSTQQQPPQPKAGTNPGQQQQQQQPSAGVRQQPMPGQAQNNRRRRSDAGCDNCCNDGNCGDVCEGACDCCAACASCCSAFIDGCDGDGCCDD